MAEVTRILDELQRGDLSAANELLPLVYSELRRLAEHRMQREVPGQTLQPTALVHEAYLRLVGDKDIAWDGRGHFFAAAAEAMRRILIESARKRKSAKRGGDRARFAISENDAIVEQGPLDDLLDLEEALQKLEKEDPKLAKLVELRYFAGLKIDEIADILDVSPRTIRRNWVFVRAWFGRELGTEPSD